MPKNYGKKKRTHKAAMIMIFFVVAFFCGTLYISNRSSEEELDKLNEEKRTLELEELRVYVKTMKYVEERAKQLGLVYPNEIIYKPK